MLLLVAPRQRKVRIEVGLGLQGRLTDAASKDVILLMLPSFKAGDFAGGVSRGTDGIIERLAFSNDAPPPANGRSPSSGSGKPN